ncbi:sulfurtransferase-like selenium metabolism protein YedF [Desulfoluna spongiiphila]|uniref:Selenium metabolism protein YedF n=1 Tax=Desulfoluna spongiiphila TaxID=419481 RepID=A0A1G5IPN4_9BACT|nr:sulfurtransferase-like selenium metabolism protein YedF [Desulfoluna spongiiphila]SCY77884.1 selenium metabolism protein YedF [Desulfoluna spongiiphila]
MEKLDFKGLACPQPVIRTKAYLEEAADCLELDVLVDNRAAAENVTRFLEGQGFTTALDGSGDLFTVSGHRTEAGGAPVAPEAVGAQGSVLVMITHDTIGTGDLVLGSKLMLNFLKTLPEMGDSLWRIMLVNEGVKLVCRDTETLAELSALEKSGVSLLVCGTCLEHFGLMGDKGAGVTTNMLDIVTSLQVADKVINM